MTRCRGFALMLALFLIVTLAALGLYMVTVSTGQVQAAAQDEQATRAYQAARAGLERAVYQRLITTAPTNTANFATTTVFTNPGLGPLPGRAGFRAEATCTLVGTESEGSTTVHVYEIVVLACNTGNTACTPSPATPASPGYVERALTVRVTQTN